MPSIPHQGSAPITEELLNPFAYGRGFLDVLYPSNPAAGSGFALTEDGRYLTRPVAIVFTLATSAAVANRFVTYDIVDGNGKVILSRGPAVAVLAGSTQKFAADYDRSGSEWTTGSTVFFGLPHLFLEPGRVLQVNVANIDGGDQISNVILTVERFPTGPRGYPEGRIGPEARRQHSVRPSHHAHRP